ncbi:hexosaminidase [Sphingomonas sp. BE138]|uniref:beta-N-acetylhexosaminidase n=1 Tax=Sphingomonas sp. BE138 TaxID=2817845 RepID=UPI002864E2B2|nr:family 20 glycosylhydrolase [Sphingomonas sp. BE138]MDR6786826.1 hexosaminidase [Sphingomonas sp. BE138]
MRRRMKTGMAAFSLTCLAVPGFAQSLLPLPRSIVRGAGSITVADGATIGAVPEASGAAKVLIEHVKATRGLSLAITDGVARIRFERENSSPGAEDYRIIVARDAIRVRAGTPAGFLNGAMTVAQLLTPDAQVGRPVRVPAMTIDDGPRFGWRGLMIDPARHVLPMAELRRIVDQMAAVKLNTLHLHLTDDQGWRFEVKRYPKLTEVGAWRTPPSIGGPAPATRVGGFYTQDALRALVAYAAERNVTIVPEIDLPGHATALVSAYPELGILGDKPPVGNRWGIEPYLFNPGPEGIAFVKAVLDELTDVFPGTYVHLGGDEALKDQWQRSAAVQAQIKALGLANEEALQSWMIDQFGAYLQTKGRRLIGWDEILEGGLPASASIMSWRGEQGAIAAANQGHDVVLSPGTPLYLDRVQSNLASEVPGQNVVSSLADVYGYEPIPAGIPADRAHHVLGAQGNVWSEYLVTPAAVQFHIFPRAAAIAEITWSAKDKRDLKGFLPRVRQQSARWTGAGMDVADSAFAVDFTIAGSRGDALRANRVPLTLATQSGYGTIRYTTDGSAPTARSRAYRAPLSLTPGTVVRAAAFDAAGVATAAVRQFDTSRRALLTRGNGALVPCAGTPFGLRVPLTPDAPERTPAFNLNLFNTCAVYPAAPLDVAGSYSVEVTRLARNWALGHDQAKLRDYYPVSPHGELLVQIGCTAPVNGPFNGSTNGQQAAARNARPVPIGTFPLPDPATAPQTFTFTGTLPKTTGDQDLCLQFTAPLGDPYYAVASVQLTERRR